MRGGFPTFNITGLTTAGAFELAAEAATLVVVIITYLLTVVKEPRSVRAVPTVMLYYHRENMIAQAIFAVGPIKHNTENNC